MDGFVQSWMVGIVRRHKLSSADAIHPFSSDFVHPYYAAPVPRTLTVQTLRGRQVYNNAGTEGVNSKIQEAITRPRDYRNGDNTIRYLMFYCSHWRKDIKLPFGAGRHAPLPTINCGAPNFSFSWANRCYF